LSQTSFGVPWRGRLLSALLQTPAHASRSFEAPSKLYTLALSPSNLEHKGSNAGNRGKDTASVKGEVGSAVGVGGTGASRSGGAAGRLAGRRSLLVGVGGLRVLRGRPCRSVRDGDGGLVGGELARVAAEDVALAAGGDCEAVSTGRAQGGGTMGDIDSHCRGSLGQLL